MSEKTRDFGVCFLSGGDDGLTPRCADDIDILQSVYRVRAPSDTDESLEARPLYNRTNKFFKARSLADLIGDVEDAQAKADLQGELARIKKLYDSLSSTYQDGKQAGTSSSSFFS